MLLCRIYSLDAKVDVVNSRGACHSVLIPKIVKKKERGCSDVEGLRREKQQCLENVHWKTETQHAAALSHLPCELRLL